MKDKFSINVFYWIADFIEFSISDSLDFNKTYIELSISSEGYKYHYAVYDGFEEELSIRQKIDFLKEFSKVSGFSFLLSDDEVNPWTWILIESTGEASGIETDS